MDLLHILLRTSLLVYRLHAVWEAGYMSWVGVVSQHESICLVGSLACQGQLAPIPTLELETAPQTLKPPRWYLGSLLGFLI